MKYRCIALFVCVFLMTACSDGEFILENFDDDVNLFDYVQLISHGGGYPPNMICGFNETVTEFGLHWLEVDPQVTLDGYIVLCHDEYLGRYGVDGYLQSYTLSELLEFDFAAPYGTEYRETKICTAEEAVWFAKKNDLILAFDFGHFDANADNVRKLYDIVQRFDYKYVIFEPNTPQDLSVIKSVSKEIPVIYTGCDANLDIPDILYDFDFAVVALNYLKVGVRTDLAKRIHDSGFKAASSVINPVPENSVIKMNELLAMGFDYIYVEGIAYSEINIEP